MSSDYNWKVLHLNAATQVGLPVVFELRSSRHFAPNNCNCWSPLYLVVIYIYLIICIHFLYNPYNSKGCGIPRRDLGRIRGVSRQLVRRDTTRYVASNKNMKPTKLLEASGSKLCIICTRNMFWSPCLWLQGYSVWWRRCPWPRRHQSVCYLLLY